MGGLRPHNGGGAYFGAMLHIWGIVATLDLANPGSYQWWGRIHLGTPLVLFPGPGYIEFSEGGLAILHQAEDLEEPNPDFENNAIFFRKILAFLGSPGPQGFLGPRARDQWTGTSGGPMDRDQWGTNGQGPVGDHWTGPRAQAWDQGPGCTRAGGPIVTKTKCLAVWEAGRHARGCPEPVGTILCKY